MPIKKLRIGFTPQVRGTEDAMALVELMIDNWRDLQDSFTTYS